MRPINRIILHYSASKYENQTAEWIDGIHKARGWSEIGYHYFLRTNGLIEGGRPLNKIGAHCRGWNTDSVGICFAGAGEPNAEQIRSLFLILHFLKLSFPNAVLQGHRELGHTLCPGFDYSAFVEYWEGLDK